MKQIIYILTLFALSCKAQQQVLPLNTSAFSSPSNSYFKDLNNQLDYYVGTWVSNFDNKVISLVITKEIKRPFEMWDKNFFTDQLIVRYEVKKNGVVLESTLNKDFTNDGKLSIDGSKIQDNGNSITLLFSGGNCSVGIGTIVLKRKSFAQFFLGYYPSTATLNDISCPPNLDYTIYLPETENLIFTKQ